MRLYLFCSFEGNYDNVINPVIFGVMNAPVLFQLVLTYHDHRFKHLDFQ